MSKKNFVTAFNAPAVLAACLDRIYILNNKFRDTKIWDIEWRWQIAEEINYILLFCNEIQKDFKPMNTEQYEKVLQNYGVYLECIRVGNLDSLNNDHS